MRNFLRQANSAGYCPTGFVDSWDEKGETKEEEWRSLVGESQSRMLINIPPIRGSQPTIKVVGISKHLKSYVNSIEGSVSSQWKHVRGRGAIKQAED